MNATDYQQEARRTLIDAPDHEFTGTELMLIWCGLGLTGEAGEVADHLKKAICHQHGLDRRKLTEELGDLVWYVAGICSLAGLTLDEVLAHNIAKLRLRYPNGYSSEDSKARVDQIPELPKPERGALDLCKMCGESIVYLEPYWDHVGGRPRHPATPTRYAV